MNDNLLLLERAKKGDKSAKDELVLNNMKLVNSIVVRFLNRGYEYEALSQIGAIGLIKAIENYNFEYGVQFSTYAVPVIAGEIKRFLRDDGIIKISRSIKETAYRGKKCAENLRKKLGREPNLTEISNESGIEIDLLTDAFNASLPVDGIMEFDSNGNEKEKKITDGRFSEEKIINKVFVSDMLEKLTKREKEILIMRYYKEKTQTETANVMGVSQVQISRIEKGAINKLKKEFSI